MAYALNIKVYTLFPNRCLNKFYECLNQQQSSKFGW